MSKKNTKSAHRQCFTSPSNKNKLTNNLLSCSPSSFKYANQEKQNYKNQGIYKQKQKQKQKIYMKNKELESKRQNQQRGKQKTKEFTLKIGKTKKDRKQKTNENHTKSSLKKSHNNNIQIGQFHQQEQKHSSSKSPNKKKLQASPFVSQWQQQNEILTAKLQIVQQKQRESENNAIILNSKITNLQSEVKLLREYIQMFKKFQAQTAQKEFDKRISKLQTSSPPLHSLQVEKKQEVHNPNRFFAFFAGDVLDGEQDYKDYLTQVLERTVGRPINKTKLLFKHDPRNKSCNIHDYIDQKEQIILLGKTKKGYHFGGYFEGKIQDKGANSGAGLIISITNRKCYKLKPQKRPVIYDRYFLIFGNSDIRVNASDPKATSNFGTINSFYDNRDDRVDALFGEGNKKQVQLESYEVHQIIFR